MTATATATAVKPEPAATPTLHLWEPSDLLERIDELCIEHEAAIEAAGGDIEAVPEIAALLAFDEAQFTAAVQRWSMNADALYEEAEAPKAQSVRLANIAKRKTNAADRIKAYLKRQLEARQLTRVKHDYGVTRIQRNSAATVRAETEGAIEDLYGAGSPFVVQKVVYEIDREKVLAHIANDPTLSLTMEKERKVVLDGGITVEVGTHLRIA